MIVDDSIMSRKYLGNALVLYYGKDNIRIIEGRTGEDACYAEEPGSIDAVFMDISMPEASLKGMA